MENALNPFFPLLESLQADVFSRHNPGFLLCFTSMYHTVSYLPRKKRGVGYQMKSEIQRIQYELRVKG